MLKAALALSLLIFVYYQVDYSSLLEQFKLLKPATAIICVFLYFTGQLVCSLKWYLLSNSSTIIKKEKSLASYIKAYFTGMFINTTGLGLVGGDLTRAMLVSSSDKNLRSSALNVFLDRLHGLGWLAAIGVSSSFYILFFKPATLPEISILLYNTFILLGCLLSVLFIFSLPIYKFKFLNKILLKFSSIKSSLLKFSPVKFSPIDLTSNSLLFLNTKTFLLTGFLSITSHLLQILMFYLILLDLGKNLSPLFLLAAIPTVNIASSLPISFQGIGVREFLIFWIFKDFGLSITESSALASSWLIFSLTVNLLSGFVLLSSPFKKLLKATATGKSTAA